MKRLMRNAVERPTCYVDMGVVEELLLELLF